MTGGPGGGSTTLRRCLREPAQAMRAADVERDGMARAAASALGRRLICDIALLGRGAEIGVTNEAVEVERRSRAGIGLNETHLRQFETSRRRQSSATASVSSTESPPADR